MAGEDPFSPLPSNPKRQASASMGGTFLQVWQTVLAWIDLEEHEILYVECAEDFDILGHQSATTVQVKGSSKTITLRSSETQEALANFWHLTTATPGRAIQFRFLTRGRIAREKGSPFGHLAGLEVWQSSKTDSSRVAVLKRFVASLDQLPKDLRQFASTASDEEFVTRLVKPVTWETASPSMDQVESTVVALLAAYGEKFGIGYTDASNARHQFYTYVCKIARQDSVVDRRLDRDAFRKAFDSATTEVVPKQRIRELEQVQRDLHRILNEEFQAVAGSVSSRLELPPQFTYGAPPLPCVYAPRDELFKRAIEILKNCGRVILCGSVATGKTTLAKLVCGSQGAPWIWVDLGSSSDSGGTTLRGLLKFMGTHRDAKNIVLDDADFSGRTDSNFGEILGALAVLVQQRNGSLVITSQRKPPARSSRILGINAASIITVNRFKIQDVEILCEGYGCSDRDERHKWSEPIHSLCAGQPQLIHGIVQFLSEHKWPKFSPSEIASVLPQLDEERSEAKSLVLKLQNGPRELLYRLSIVGSPFRRDHALELATAAPAVTHPGEALDRLIGAWVESLPQGYYRVSPLIANIGFDMWGPSERQKLHLSIVNAFFQAEALTPRDAATVLLHAYLGKLRSQLGSICVGLNKASQEIFDSAARYLRWFAIFRTGLGEILFEGDSILSSLLRYLQLRIALRLEGQLAPKVIEAWQREIDTFEKHDQSWVQHYLFGMAIIAVDESRALSSTKLLGHLRSLDRSQREHAEFFSQANQQSGRDSTHANDFRDIVRSGGLLIGYRSGERERFEQLLDALSDSDSDFRNRFIEGLSSKPENVSHFVEQVWIHEAEKPSPDWEACLRAFEKVCSLAANWETPQLVDSAIRAIAIVIDEYQQMPRQALEAIERLTNTFKRDSPLIRHAKAMVLFHLDRFDEALEIWESTLQMWPVHDLTEFSALRMGAVAAGKLGRWLDSVGLFSEARRRLKSPLMAETTAGIWADSGYALWRAGQSEQALNAFATALSRLRRLESLRGRGLRVHKVKRLMGQTLLWISHETGDRIIQTYDPGPGICSDLDAMKQIESQSETELDLSWCLLLRIERNLATKPLLASKHLNRLISSSNALVRVMALHLKFFYRMQEGEFTDLPVEITKYSEDLRKSRDSIVTLAQSVKSELASTIPVIEDDYAFKKVVFLAALVSVVSEGRLRRSLLSDWAIKVVETELKAWLSLAENLIFGEQEEALTVLRNPQASSDHLVLAGINVLANFSDHTPEDLLRAQVAIVMQLGHMVLTRAVFVRVAKLFARQWREKARFPAVLRSPRITIPNLLEACDEGGPVGLRMAVKIILAAQPCTSVYFAPSLLKQIRAFLETDTTNRDSI